MNISDIEIFSGQPDFAFEPIRRLEVKCEATNALMPAPTIDEANGRLRALAAKVGAHAIIEADYNSGISFTSWKSLKATGLAVRRLSDEMQCPFCAETVKKAAVKCRHCGSDIGAVLESLQNSSVDERESAAKVVPSSYQKFSDAEPLRDNNNPAIIIGLVAFGLFLLMLIIGSAG